MTAALAEVDTLARARKAHHYKHDCWCILDECSQIAEHQWNWNAQLQYKYVSFLISGDFAGQLLPVSAGKDGFDDASLEQSNFMHCVRNGLRGELTHFRRTGADGTSDRVHSDFVLGLYPHDLSLAECLQVATRHYPSPPGRVNYYLNMSHRSRRNIKTGQNMDMSRKPGVNHVLELTPLPPEVKRGSMANLTQEMAIWRYQATRLRERE